MASVRFEDENGIKYGIERTGNVPHVIVKGPVDSKTLALEVISYAHHEIHSGSMYMNEATATIGANAIGDTLVVTPPGLAFAHMFHEAIVEAAMVLSVFEDCTVAASGTWLQSYNHNRNSASAPGLKFYASPTVTNAGTRILQEAAGSGQKAGGDTRETHEIIYKPSTLYLYRCLNLSAQAKWISNKFNYYNHTDK